MATSSSGTYEPIQTYQEYHDSEQPSSRATGSTSADRGPPPVLITTTDVAIPGEDDAKEIAMYMRVEGQQIFVEADGVRSLPQVYEIAVLVYNQVKAWTYIILTTVFAVLMAIIWGLFFAIVSFLMIWCVNPAIRVMYIMIRSFSKLWATVYQSCFDPVYLSFALIFSRAKVGVNLRKGAIVEV